MLFLLSVVFVTTQCKIPYYSNISCSSWPVVFSLIQKDFHVKFLVSLFSHFISITFTIYTFVLVRVFLTVDTSSPAKQRTSPNLIDDHSDAATPVCFATAFRP